MIKPGIYVPTYQSPRQHAINFGEKKHWNPSLLENIREAPTLLLQIVVEGEVEWKSCSRHWILSVGGGKLFLVVRHAKYQY